MSMAKLQGAISKGSQALYQGIEKFNEVHAELFVEDDNYFFNFEEASLNVIYNSAKYPFEFKSLSEGYDNKALQTMQKSLTFLAKGLDNVMSTKNPVVKAYAGMYMVMTDTLLLSIDVVSNAKTLSSKAIASMTQQLEQITDTCKKFSVDNVKNNIKAVGGDLLEQCAKSIDVLSNAKKLSNEAIKSITKQLRKITDTYKKFSVDNVKQNIQAIGGDLLEQCAKLVDFVKNEVSNIPDRTIQNITRLSNNIQNSRQAIDNTIDPILHSNKAKLIADKGKAIKERSQGTTFADRIKAQRETRKERSKSARR